MNKKNCDLAFVISDLGGGGAQRVLVTLANTWAKSGRQIAVITFSQPKDDFFELESSIERHVIGGIGRSSGALGGVLANIRRITALRKCLRGIAPQNTFGFVGTTNIIVILAALGLPIKLFVSERNDPARQSLGRLWDTLRRLLYRYADVVTANSHSAISTLSQYVPKHKLAYVPNPINCPQADNSAPRKGNTILAVGRLYPQKGYDTLLQAFSIFHKARPGWELTILGDGPLKDDMHKLSVELDIADKVSFKGKVKDPFPFYRAADIYVLSSRFEGTPNALLEAMGQGAPVVVTDALLGALQYVEHEKTGLVVNVDDAQDLAEALERLAGDEVSRRSLGEQGQKLIAELSQTHGVRAWEELLGWAK